MPAPIRNKDKGNFAEGLSELTPIGGVLNDSPGTDPAEDQVAAARITPKRAIHVNLRNNAGTEVTLGGGASQADESAFIEGTTNFNPIGGVLNETIVSDPTEDQAAAARITPKRAVHTNLRNNSGTEIGTDTNPVRTDPTGTTAQPVTDNAGSLTVDAPVGTPAAVRVSDGAAFVDVREGNVAHDGADGTSNPVKVGAKAIAHGANPTAVAADDRTNLYSNRHGVPFVIGGHMNAITRRDNFTTAQSNVALVTVAAGLKIVVTRVLVTVSNAATVSPAVRIGFGTASTPVNAGVVAAHPGIPSGGGFSTGDGSGILGVGADDEDLRITSDVPTGGSIDVVVTYYTIES